jgi:hypothetical protein
VELISRQERKAQTVATKAASYITAETQFTEIGAFLIKTVYSVTSARPRCISGVLASPRIGVTLAQFSDGRDFSDKLCRPGNDAAGNKGKGGFFDAELARHPARDRLLRTMI